VVKGGKPHFHRHVFLTGTLEQARGGLFKRQLLIVKDGFDRGSVDGYGPRRVDWFDWRRWRFAPISIAIIPRQWPWWRRLRSNVLRRFSTGWKNHQHERNQQEDKSGAGQQTYTFVF
jgi:hypothetical protein